MTSAFAIAALGLTIGLTSSTGSSRATLDAATAPAATTAKAPAYVLLNCASKAVTKPSSYTITCADGGILLKGLHWTTWSSRFAGAYGTLSENDCKPYCVDGHFHDYSVIVTAWGSGSVKGHSGERAYTKLTLTFPGSSRPPIYHLVNGKLVATYPVTQLVPAS
jgi:hypothetical protein